MTKKGTWRVVGAAGALVIAATYTEAVAVSVEKPIK